MVVARREIGYVRGRNNVEGEWADGKEGVREEGCGIVFFSLSLFSTFSRILVFFRDK